MNAIFISVNQAFFEDVLEILEREGQRGYTSWDIVNGRGSNGGEPHLGDHTWPTQNSALITIVPKEKTDVILEKLHALDKSSEQQGLRAFVWDITKTC